MTPKTIQDVVLACLKAQGLAVVRAADTTYARDDLERAFAKDVAAHVVMTANENETEDQTWSPAQAVQS